MTKAEVVEEKLVKLLDRLFGRNNVMCMNIQNRSGGLLSDLRDEFRDKIEELKDDISDLKEEIAECKKPKSRRKR